MPSVFLCSPTNSTMFTTCCHAAILDDQTNCPICKLEISPRSGRDRWDAAFGQQRRNLDIARRLQGGRS